MIVFNLFITSLLAFSATDFFYPESYQQGRDVFRARSQKIKKKFFEDAETGQLQVPTQLDTKLTTDYLYIPQRSAKKTHLLILTSGVHGAEAFAGSAIQVEFLKKIGSNPQLLDKVGFLIVHAVNPYGFHKNRRVTENNVDLNRNFILEKENYKKERPDYEKLSHFLNPKKKLNYSLFNNLSFYARSIYLLITQGRQALANAIVSGQYTLPQGVFYGGKEQEVNVKNIYQLFKDKASDYQNIFHIDLHTGYGERGTLHFFTTNDIPKQVQENRNRIFEGFNMDTGDDEDFYKISGEFTVFTMKAFPGKSVIPMTFEFGTSDSQTTTGVMFSLRSMVQENQAFHHGTTNEESFKKIQEDFTELFNPTEDQWRNQTMNDAQTTLDTVIERFSAL